MPHSSDSNYINNAQWDSKTKRKSRLHTIVEIYEDAFGVKSIPEDKQYWSMCGAHFNNDGPLKGEFGQLLECNLINKDQFFGVDIEEEIIAKNKELYPETNWLNNDFLEAMMDCKRIGEFYPSIINYDGVMQPEFGSQYFRNILSFIDYNISNELLLVGSFVLENPYTKSKRQAYTIDDVADNITKRYLIPKHWVPSPVAYIYKNVRAKMGVIAFAKHEHDPTHISYN
jgi:hypothetical protein